MQYLHDPRLDNLTPGQYRLWHDAQNILVPVGQSTTKPLAKEIVNANAKVYGEINKSYFVPPWVDFTNTNVDTERFDRYRLQTWRDEFPVDNPEIDYHFDMGMNRIITIHDTAFTSDVFAGGSWQSFAEFQWREGKTWETREYHAIINNITTLELDFFLVTNPTAIHTAQGKAYPTTAVLQNVNLPITVILRRATIHNGNSKMTVLAKNGVYFPVNLAHCNIAIIGGE